MDISNGATLYTIDNSHIITKHLPSTVDSINDEMSLEAALTTSVLEDNRKIYDALCCLVSYSENKMREEADNIKSILKKENLVRIKENIPRPWIYHFGNDKIEKILEMIGERVKSVSEISEMIIEERRSL